MTKRYRIELHRSAKKFLASLPKNMRERIVAAIDHLGVDPRPPGCLKLTDFNPEAWRIRIGKYRVLYQIVEDEVMVWIFNVDLRDDAYSN